MSDFTPSEQQAEAIRQIVEWYRNRIAEQQVFRVFGYAGSGKTTTIKAAIEALGLQPATALGGRGGVLYGAFTGKAALVMTRKGTPASTIHSLIYRVSEATPEEIERATRELTAANDALRSAGPGERLLLETRVHRLELRLRDAHQPSFLLNPDSPVRDADLIVLDEVSMVGTEMAGHLLSFGKPVLVLGDPGQLPPIKGEGAFTDVEPDVMLTEIHRQAGESAIIRLATMARQGEPIPYGRHDDFVWKMQRRDVTAHQLLRGGQVICGRNATRLMLNNDMRYADGVFATYPQGCGEKIICLKNRNDIGIVNGMFLTLKDVRDENALAFSAEVETEDGDAIPGRKRFYKGFFDDHVAFDPDRTRRDWKDMKNLLQSVWGYAITCHKAQGSQWENVIVYDDGLGRTAEDRARWCYTAITRAERGLVILD